MVGTVRKSQIVNQLGGAGHGVGARSASYHGRKSHIFSHCEFRQQLVKLKYESYMGVAELGQLVVRQAEYVSAVKLYRAAVRAVK